MQLDLKKIEVSGSIQVLGYIRIIFVKYFIQIIKNSF